MGGMEEWVERDDARATETRRVTLNPGRFQHYSFHLCVCPIHHLPPPILLS
jgi:hypothetical protein